jgi:hypothetical protein
MNRHHGHRRHYVAPNEQDIPVSHHSNNHEITLRSGYLKSPVPRAEAIWPHDSSEQSSQHSLDSPEVLPAPFKLHKPPSPCRLPSSRCI